MQQKSLIAILGLVVVLLLSYALMPQVVERWRNPRNIELTAADGKKIMVTASEAFGVHTNQINLMAQHIQGIEEFLKKASEPKPQ